MKNKLIKIILSSAVMLAVLFTGVAVCNAEDASSQEGAATDTVVTELIEKCAELPSAENVTLDDKELIMEIKQGYDSLDRAGKASLGADNLTKINECVTALEPYLLGYVVTKLEELPKKIRAKNKDRLVEIYNEYDILSDDAKESIDPELSKKFLDAVKEYAPELLGDEADAQDNDGEQTEETTETASSGILGMHAWEFAILCLLSVVIVLNIVLIVFAAVKIFGK